MPKTRPLMRLSREEERFLRHWMHDEIHYQDQVGLAKRLQVEHGVPPADLATLIAAAMPDPLDQEAAAQDALPSEPPRWPWASAGALHARIEEAREIVRADGASGAPNSTR
jgi:hypothetical protein